MTGYVWLCEHCDGEGELITMSSIDGNSQYYIKCSPYVYKYFGKAPYLVTCEDCKGTGIWRLNETTR